MRDDREAETSPWRTTASQCMDGWGDSDLSLREEIWGKQSMLFHPLSTNSNGVCDYLCVSREMKGYGRGTRCKEPEGAVVRSFGRDKRSQIRVTGTQDAQARIEART